MTEVPAAEGHCEFGRLIDFNSKESLTSIRFDFCNLQLASTAVVALMPLTLLDEMMIPTSTNRLEPSFAS